MTDAGAGRAELELDVADESEEWCGWMGIKVHTDLSTV